MLRQLPGNLEGSLATRSDLGEKQFSLFFCLAKFVFVDALATGAPYFFLSRVTNYKLRPYCGFSWAVKSAPIGPGLYAPAQIYFVVFLKCDVNWGLWLAILSMSFILCRGLTWTKGGEPELCNQSGRVRWGLCTGAILPGGDGCLACQYSQNAPLSFRGVHYRSIISAWLAACVDLSSVSLKHYLVIFLSFFCTVFDFLTFSLYALLTVQAFPAVLDEVVR